MQPAYIDKVIEKYGMQDAKCVSTPVDASSKLAKSVESDVCFVREQVSAGTIELKYCPSGQMVADMLTKGLSCGTFELLRKMAGIVSLPVSFSSK